MIKSKPRARLIHGWWYVFETSHSRSYVSESFLTALYMYYDRWDWVSGTRLCKEWRFT